MPRLALAGLLVLALATPAPAQGIDTYRVASPDNQYVAIARRNGDTWFVGAMTNWNARTLTIGLTFLGDRSYEAVIFRDGINADRDARDYAREGRRVTAGDRLEAEMMPGGGWTARISPVQ